MADAPILGVKRNHTPDAPSMSVSFHKVTPNVLQRQFNPSAPNKVGSQMSRTHK